MTFAAGRVLLGRFRVVSAPASPARVVVLEARDDSSPVQLFVGELSAGSTESPERVLARTAPYARGVPGLASPVASGTEDGSWVIAYAPTGTFTLPELLRAGPLSAARAAALARAFGDALGPLHDQGLSHGHLRPEGLVLDEQRWEISGFGVARVAAELGRAGESSDVPAHVAPEVGRGSVGDPASDTYAAGALLARALGGVEALPMALRDVIQSALSPEPARRPTDIVHWSRRVERLLRDAATAGSSEAAAPERPAESLASASAPTLPQPQPEDVRVGDVGAAERSLATSTSSLTGAVASAAPSTVGAVGGGVAGNSAVAGTSPAPSSGDARVTSAGEAVAPAGTAGTSWARPEGGVGDEALLANSASTSPPGTSGASTAGSARGTEPFPGRVPSSGASTAGSGRGTEPGRGPPTPGASAGGSGRGTEPPPGPGAEQEERGYWGVLAVVAIIVAPLVMIGGAVALFAYAVARPSAAPAAPTSVATVAADAGSAPPPAAPSATAAPPPARAPAPGPAPTADAGTLSPPAPASGSAPTAGSGPAISAADREAAMPLDPEQPVLGKAGALVTIVAFGDLEDAHTRSAVVVLGRLRATFGEDLRVAWRHRPLPGNPHADGAAHVAASLHEQRGTRAFWKLLEEAAKSEDPPRRAELERWVSAAGGDAKRVAAWRTSKRAGRRVAADQLQAALFDVRATPTLFINGSRFDGLPPYAVLRKAVEVERRAARSLLATGAPKTELYRRRSDKNLVNLGDEIPARHCPSAVGAPARGARDALVTIVEYSDFECPFCARVQTTLESVRKRYGRDVRLIWKHYPLGFHPNARAAANLAIEAQRRGGDDAFWKAHDSLFADQSNLGAAAWSRAARAASLPESALLDAARDTPHEKRIDADVSEGERLGVRGTPNFFINGRRLAGAVPEAQFRKIIDEELASARKLVAGGTERSRVYSLICGE